MKTLEDKDGKKYTGDINGGVFAIWDKDKKNVGNYADEADAVKLGGYKITGEVEGEKPKTTANDSSAKAETAGEGSPGTTKKEEPSNAGATDTPESAKTEPTSTPS